MIRLSRSRLQAIDRRPGAEMILPWPELLPTPTLAAEHERPATPTEKAAALKIVAAAVDAHDLVVLAVRVAMLDGLVDRDVACVAPRLVVHLRTRRWWKTGLGGSPGFCWVLASELAPRSSHGDLS